MIASNIFRWIGSFFTDFLFIPYDWLRKGGFNWWFSNIINYIFLIILFALLWYWIKESYSYLKNGTEDRN